MKNLELAEIFREIALILEIKGENLFRIRAYQRAAQNIEGLTEDIEDFIRTDRLKEIPGIGADLSERIKEFVKTDRIKVYEDLKKSIPAGVLSLLEIPSIGPKTAKMLYGKLKIKGIADLERAIEEHMLEGIKGVKEKTIANIQKGITLLKTGKEHMPLALAMQIADDFVSALKKIPGIGNVCVAGSLRRRKETVRDIDILAVSDSPKKVMDTFSTLPAVKDILAHGQTKSSIRTQDGVQVDCRAVDVNSFGAAMVYFTGSKNFNIKLRQIAIKKGLKLNEYGLFRKNKFVAGKTEAEMFKHLGLPYVEPELREDTGEIQLALKSKLPILIELKDIKGDLHVHSKWSDGMNGIEDMAQAASKLGYSYIAMTDHSQSLRVANGLNKDDLKKKRLEIDKVNKKMKNFRVLYGTEVEINSDGSIDYSEDILKQFDVVVAAIHIAFKQGKEKLTSRIVNACRNKHVHIIAHPTGRLWGTRDAYDINFDEVLKVARETNTALEINSFPNRLDLNDTNVRRAKAAGVKIAINSDAHIAEQLKVMQFGIFVARRGWLERKDVINTLPLEQLLKTIKNEN